MNQQRPRPSSQIAEQNTESTWIDLTKPHQVAVGRLVGVIGCDERIRIKRRPRTGAEPHVLPTDTLSHMSHAADLVVSFNGGNGPADYKLQIELKTTTHNSMDNLELFRHVKNIRYPDTGERNLAQFEKLTSVHNSVNSHYWWYIIVCTGRLAFNNQAMLEREFGKCKAMLVQGQAPISDPTFATQVMEWDDLMQHVAELLEKIPSESSARQKSSRATSKQQELPIDDAPKSDVPDVTMNLSLIHI